MKEKKNLSELITAYADGELTLEEERMLLEHADRDPSVKAAIIREQRTKDIVKTHCRRERVPEQLYQSIQLRLKAEQAEAEAFSQNTRKPENRSNRYWMPLAALLVLSLFVYLFQQYNQASGSGELSYSFEELTYIHFANHSGGFIQPVIQADTTFEAQQYLKNTYGCDITVPELLGAQFAGVIYVDFFEGFHTPLLTYRTDDDTYIYIFAAELINLTAQPNLHPLEEAFAQIRAHNDVFIKTFNGHDVVSWKWDDVWYAGVSQHDGRTLAAMLPH